MYGYAYTNSFRSGGGSSVPFHPSTLTGGQLYLRQDQATVSSWISDIGTARDFQQATSTQQPIISTNSVDFDNVNDYQRVSEIGSFYSDSKGIMCFSGYYDNSNRNILLSSAWVSVSNQYVMISIETSGKVRFWCVNAGTGGINTVIEFDEVLTNGSYYYFSIEGQGSGLPYIGVVNGVTSTKTVIQGFDNSIWWGGVTGRSNLVVGSLQRSGSLYSPAKINKIYYNNTALTSGEKSSLTTFFSDPTNY